MEQFPDPKYLNSVPLIFYIFIFIFIFIKVILTWREPRLALIRITKCPRVEEFFNNNKFVKKKCPPNFLCSVKIFLGFSRESDELITKISSFVLLIIKDIFFMILLIQFGRICVTSSQVGR